jgi:hypothetical protein
VSDGEEPRSGLRNPTAAVRGVGAGTLVLECVVLLMAIVPLVKLGGANRGTAIVVTLTLMVCCAVLAGLLRYRWAWYAAAALQAALLLTGFLNVALGVLGLVFGAVWLYVLHVRRTITG